jgi:hypothetical protein
VRGGFRARGTTDHQWAAELRLADERCTELRKKYDDIVRAKMETESRIKKQESQIEARDNEILRLGDLYQGGQNLEKLNMQYQQDTNEKVTKKLAN